MDVTRLRRLLREVDEEHRDTLRTVTDDMAAAAHAASRRTFLRGSLAAGGAAALVLGPLAASASAADAGTTTTAPPKTPQAGDLTLLGFAQSLELAAVGVYDAALATGKLTDVPKLLAAAFKRHHTEHAEAIGGLAGKGAPGAANPGLLKLFADKVSAAKTENDVLGVAFELENAAAATYAYALGSIVGTNPASLVASIQPIEARHAVVLGEALNLTLKDFVPAFEPNAVGYGALDPAKYPATG